MAQNDTPFSVGQAVRVYANPYMRSKAETDHVDAGRPATIERQMPDAEDYEVKFSDDAEPISAFVTADSLLPAGKEGARARHLAKRARRSSTCATGMQT